MNSTDPNSAKEAFANLTPDHMLDAIEASQQSRAAGAIHIHLSRTADGDVCVHEIWSEQP